MLDKNQILEKQKELKTQQNLLKLHNHKTLGDYIIVVPAEIDEPGITTRAVQFEERPEIGLVVSVGEAISNIEIGDVVFFGKYSHVQITHDDLIYLIMRREDIYCVAESDNK